MSNPAVAGLKEFFEQIWGDTEGFVYLPVKEGNRIRKFFLAWPEKKDAVVRHILKFSADDTCEVFFSPALYRSMSAKNNNVLGSQVVWADFDGSFPKDWPTDIVAKPSIEVQSSVDSKRHTYWKLDEFTDPKTVERINRSLAYALGADTSGWDANQFLRPPFSVNRKYSKPMTTKVVADRAELVPYSVKDFSGLPTPAEAIREEIDMGSVPSIEEVKTLATWDSDLLELFNTDETTARGVGWDRSGALARVAYKGAELGWSDEQIYAALLDADGRWGKYVGRTTREKILIELINRARAKVGYDLESEGSLIKSLLDKVKDVENEEDEIPDFLSVDDINAIPGRDDWTIEGLLTKQGLGLFTGRPGTGKTQLALQCAADLATGRPDFIDYPLSGEAKKVLFLSLEMSVYQLQHFTVPLRKRYHEPELAKNLVIYGKGEPVFMNTEEGQHLVDSWLDDFTPDVVIVDSLSQATTDLSSDDEMSKLFAFLKVLRRYHQFGLIFIHHHRKKANDAQSRKQANTQSDIYGSYQIAATIDFALDLEDRGGDDGLLDLQLLKARFRPTGDPVKISRDDDLHFAVQDLSVLSTQDMVDPSRPEINRDI